MKLYYVEYLDTSLTEQIWQKVEEAKIKSRLAICQAGGFLLSEDSAEIKITISYTENSVLDVLTIPRSNIIKMVAIPEDIYK